MNARQLTGLGGVWLLIAFGASMFGKAATPISVDEAIVILKGVESQIQVIEWVAHFREAILSDASDATSVVEFKPQYGKSHVVFSPISGKYFAELESVWRWYDGAADYVSKVEIYSFDGEVFRNWWRESPGQQLPTPDMDAGRGFVTREINVSMGPRDFIKDYCWLVGLCSMPPLCYDFNEPPMTLSALLRERVREGIPVFIEEDDAGIWTVRLDDPSRYHDRLELRVDPGRSGVVVGAEWRGGQENRLWRRMDVEVDEIRDGVFAPVRISHVAVLDRPPLLQQIEFSDVKANHGVSEESFRLVFPPGVHVDDHIEQRSYTVGRDIDSQVEQVRLYRERYAGTLAAAAADRVSRTRSWILGLGVTLVAGVLIWWTWRVGWKGMASLLVPLLLHAPLLLHGTVANGAELDPDGNWVISHAPGERIVVSQCGFTVASFALMHFDREFDAKILSKALRPENEGVSVSDLRAAFEAYGLSAILRKNVTVSQLGRALTPGRIAIVPLQLRRDQNHYFVAMLDGNRKPLLVNVLFGHGPLADALSDEAGGELVRLCFLFLGASTGCRGRGVTTD